MRPTKQLVLVGCSLLALAAGVFYLFGPEQENKNKVDPHVREITETVEGKPKFGFKDIFSSNFSYSSVSPRWISGTQYVIMESNRDVVLRDVTTSNVTILMPGSFYTDNSARSYKVSSTKQYILLLTNYEKIWRHSYNGTYLLFDVAAQALSTDFTLPDDVQYITWAPNENALAYVYDYDIFYRETPTSPDINVTLTGRANFVYNGIPDWVYEEEMISSNNAMYFSPGGSYLAFAQFNDTTCEHIEFNRFDGEQYPKMIDVSYPKAGTSQPTNKVFIFNKNNTDMVEIEPPVELSSDDFLFSRVTWANDSRVTVTWCDRLQTHSVMLMCDVQSDFTWNCQKALEHSSKTGWLYQRRPYWIPVFGETLDEFFVVLPDPDTKWQHLARINENTPTFLTSGEYTVTSYSASYPAVEYYDATNDYVYFLSTYDGPKGRHVYRRRGRLDAGQATDDAPECVTCKLMTSYEGRCTLIQPTFSTDASYIVVGCRGEGPPIYLQYRVDHSAASVNDVLLDEVVLQANDDLVAAVNATQWPQKVYGTIDSKTGYKFHYEQWNPPNFDENKQYPLLIDVYAGPGYQNVDAYWTRSWAPVYVPSGLDAIVARIDGRGSNFHGDTFMHEVYQNLGQKEIDDQLEAAEYFGNLAYVDAGKIAMWGWSYGGFATSHAIGKNSGLLKCGVAVAPLTDWRYYDTIYAERYMGKPQNNEPGYEGANIMNKAANFPQSSYYLIHGMADDNVHFQNAAQLSKALVDADVDFVSYYYADQDHSINAGPNTSRHVYQMITKYLCTCFDIPVPADVWDIN